MNKIFTLCLLACIVIVTRSQAVPLPIQLISFQGNINKANKVTLQWTIANNATVDQFEVQRSYDSIEFKTIGIVFSSEKKDTEDYLFYETIGSFDKVMYRLKMIGKEKEIGYSKILVFQPNVTTNQNKIREQYKYSFTLNPSIKPNFYQLEVNNGIDIQIPKFLKQQISAAKSIIS